MVTPTVAQIDAGITVARAQLTSISGWIDYNNEISDAQMLAFMTKVASAILNAQPPKGN
jgi:hypothetical protein